MANVLIEEQTLKDIAYTIRSANGTDTKYKPSEMNTEIDVISNKIAEMLESTSYDLVDYRVTFLAKHAFAYKYCIKSVTFPNVLTVGERAFWGSEISIINLPNVTAVDKGTFESCDLLTSISLPKLEKGLSTDYNLGYHMFYYCPKLTSVNLPNALFFSGYEAFRGDEMLVTVNLPKATIKNTSNMFYPCKALKNVTLKPNSVSENFSFSSSNLLTTTSIQNIIDALATVETSCKLTLHSTVKNKLTDAQLQQITAKNWTLG